MLAQSTSHITVRGPVQTILEKLAALYMTLLREGVIGHDTTKLQWTQLMPFKECGSSQNSVMLRGGREGGNKISQ